MKSIRERVNDKLAAAGVRGFDPDAVIFNSVTEAVEEFVTEVFKEWDDYMKLKHQQEERMRAASERRR